MRSLFRHVSECRINSAVLRKLLALYYREGNIYRVPFGPNRGRRLLFSRDLNFHMALGLWEVRGLRLLKAVFDVREFWPEHATVVDVGANVGYVTLVLAQYTSRYSGRVVAFEASPDTFAVLTRNVELNAGWPVELVEAAVADKDGTVNFYVSHHHHSSSLVESWAMGERPAADSVTVRSVTLDTYFDSLPNAAPALIKMDIEGGGVYAIPGMLKLVGKYEPFIFIESHTPEEDEAVCSLVRRLSYSAFRCADLSWATEPTQGYPNMNGVYGTVLLCPPRHLDRCKRVVAQCFGSK